MEPLDLNIPLSGVDTSRPLLQDGMCIMTILELEREENKARNGHNLMATFATTTPMTSRQGRDKGLENDIQPGFTLRKYYPLQQSENPKAPDFRADLCRLVDAAFKTDINTRPALSLETLTQMKGKRVVVTTAIRNDAVYGESNEIVKIGSLAA